MGDADPSVVVQATSTFMLEISPTPVVFTNPTWDSGLLLSSIRSLQPWVNQGGADSRWLCGSCL
jgi:hypothetical protein